MTTSLGFFRPRLLCFLDLRKEHVMLKQLLREELEYEKNELSEIFNRITGSEEYNLKYSEGCFRYRDKKESNKYRYLKKEEHPLLRKIATKKFRITKANILTYNIELLESFIDKISDYDDETIIAKMPKAYQAAIKLLRSNYPLEKVIQSENPKHRDKLVINASDGLKVRTKGELNLYETLISFGLTVRYEKALVLKERTILSNGKVTEKDVTVYPDFTIIFPDGSRIYWELNGLYDNTNYRMNQFDKFNLYYDNGIYMPYNLIVTMESEDKPLNMVIIRRIIESEILPRALEQNDQQND